ncbi:MAG: phospholipase D-like domain-containing protein, partial [Bacillota bacterium]|nr:phospholipase D-like domain-containing protein [Bacillota bacterium]
MKKKIKGLWKILFGRTAILALLIMIQALVFVLGVLVLDSTIIIANNITGILSVLILIYLVNNRQNNSFKLMWIVIIVATPLIGVPFYVFTRIQPGRRILDGKLETLQEDQHDYLLPENSIIKEMMNEENRELGLFKYLFERAHFPMYKDCGIKYFPLGENKYEELLKQLKRAKKFIFIEYFIIEKGLMWDSILEILQQKAREGVEVRLIYDGTNTLLRLPKNYPKKLEAMGIQCRVFSPLVPFMSTHQNNRDHRKIVVIDGHTAFTGGVNLADEYINAVKRFGHWKDTAIMVRGKAVNSFTLMFLQMWNVYDINKLERYDRYMFAGSPQDDSLDYGGYIAPYSDSPLDGEEVGKKVYLDILNRATRYVHIMTPYLILDEE